jgi:WD40 repeat protein
MKTNARIRRRLTGAILVLLSFFRAAAAEDLKPRLVLKGHTKRPGCAAISADGAMLASGGQDQTVRFWDLAEGKELKRLQHREAVVAAAFAPDGKTLAAAGDKEVKLWEVLAGKELAAFAWKSGRVLRIAYSPKGESLVASGYASGLTGQAMLWDVATRKQTSVFRGQGQPDNVPDPAVFGMSIAFSPDGKTLAVGGGFIAEGTIHLVDVASGETKAILKENVGLIEALAFAPDGKTLASVGRRMNALWNVPMRKLKLAFQTPDRSSYVWDVVYAPALAFTASGEKLIEVSYGRAKIWDVASGQSQATFRGLPGPWTISNDLKILVAGSEDDSLRVLDLGSLLAEPAAE